MPPRKGPKAADGAKPTKAKASRATRAPAAKPSTPEPRSAPEPFKAPQPPAPRVVPAHVSWTEKHRPRTLDEIIGNGPAIAEIKAWAEAWKDGAMPEERALILAGDAGVGKTTAAHALARDLGWNAIELNASDARNYDEIRRIATPGATHAAFSPSGEFSRRPQIVILDEADNLFGQEDRGGMKAIVETIREARNPIILIVNDLYELTRKGAALKSLARTIKFTRINKRSIPKALQRIAAAEGVAVEPDALVALAERSGGDMRSAVNDLQALSQGRTEVAVGDVEALGKRDVTGDIWGLLGKVFYGRDPDEARRATWDLDETPEQIALWIDENLPVMYTKPADLVAGYQALSRADVYLGRTSRRQQFGLWRYAGEMMTAGVAVAKFERPAGARFQFPSWLSKQSRSKGTRETRDSIALKLGGATHTSKRVARQEHFPLLKTLLAGEPAHAAKVARDLDLEPEEIAFLLGEKENGPRTKAITKILEAESPRPKAVVVEEETVDEGDGEGEGAPSTKPGATKDAPVKDDPKKQKSLFEF